MIQVYDGDGDDPTPRYIVKRQRGRTGGFDLAYYIGYIPPGLLTGQWTTEPGRADVLSLTHAQDVIARYARPGDTFEIIQL